jgi:invasion protein IalB
MGALLKPDGEKVGIPVSLSGFTPAFEGVQEA